MIKSHFCCRRSNERFILCVCVDKIYLSCCDSVLIYTSNQLSNKTDFMFGSSENLIN